MGANLHRRETLFKIEGSREMTHTNISIGITGNPSFDQDRSYMSNKEVHLLKAELEFYKQKSRTFANELENIPEAIKEYGYVEITYGEDRKFMKLVEEKELK